MVRFRRTTSRYLKPQKPEIVVTPIVVLTTKSGNHIGGLLRSYLWRSTWRGIGQVLRQFSRPLGQLHQLFLVSGQPQRKKVILFLFLHTRSSDCNAHFQRDCGVPTWESESFP